MRVAVVGDPRDVRGFRLAGVDGRPCAPAALQREVARAMADPKIGVILVAARGAKLELPHRTDGRGQGAPPAILLLPEGSP